MDKDAMAVDLAKRLGIPHSSAVDRLARGIELFAENGWAFSNRWPLEGTRSHAEGCYER